MFSKSPSNASDKVKSPSGRWLRARTWRGWVVRLLACALGMLCVYHGSIVVRLFKLRQADPTTTSMMEQQYKESLARGATPRREFVWIPYRRISPNLVRAVLAGEDLRFFHHPGVDWRAIHLASKRNWEDQKISRGASTVNQQLAKNLFLTSSKNPVRKLHEAIIALEMERILDERRILELYLNIIEWGDGIYGAEAAARHYFNTSAAALDREQAAFLAAIIPNPRAEHDPRAYTREDEERISKITRLMEHPWLKHPLLEVDAGQAAP